MDFYLAFIFVYMCVFILYFDLNLNKKKKESDMFFVYHFTYWKHCSDSQKQKKEAVRQLDTENHNKISL